MLSFISQSIQRKILAIPVGIILAVCAAVLLYFPSARKGEARRALEAEVDLGADLLAFGFGVALEAGDLDGMMAAYEVVKSKKDVSYVIIFDDKGEKLSVFNPKGFAIDTTRARRDSAVVEREGFLEKSVPIAYKGNTYGSATIGASLEGVRALVRSTILYTLLAAAVFLAGAMLVAWLLVRRIVAPIRGVEESLRAVRQGDLTRHCRIDQNDEIGQIASGVDAMIQALSDMVARLRESGAEVSRMAQSLAGATSSIGRSSESNAVSLSSIASAVEQSSASVESISSSGREMSGAIEVVASAVEEVNASLAEVAKTCQGELGITGDAVRQAGNASAKMAQLHDATKEVAKVLDLIQEIADQSKLLALNATIEAARAGETGKGFAVVAGEVKVLARQTSSQADSIRSLIAAMQQGATDASQAVGQVVGVVSQIDGYSHTIVSAVEEQSATMREIAHSMALASQSARQVSVNVSGASAGLAEIARQVSEASGQGKSIRIELDGISRSSADLRATSLRMDELFARFRLTN